MPRDYIITFNVNYHEREAIRRLQAAMNTTRADALRRAVNLALQNAGVETRKQ